MAISKHAREGGRRHLVWNSNKHKFTHRCISCSKNLYNLKTEDDHKMKTAQKRDTTSKMKMKIPQIKDDPKNEEDSTNEDGQKRGTEPQK